jgi:hypothetical protein
LQFVYSSDFSMVLLKTTVAFPRLDESVLVKEEQSSAEDNSWNNEDKEESGESEKRFIFYFLVFLLES